MLKIYLLVSLSALMLLTPMISLKAYYGGPRGGAGSWAHYNPRYEDRRFVDPNYYYYGVPNGPYVGPAQEYDGGGYNYNYNSGSPGMTDDSNALYQSYLRANGQ